MLSVDIKAGNPPCCPTEICAGISKAALPLNPAYRRNTLNTSAFAITPASIDIDAIATGPIFLLLVICNVNGNTGRRSGYSRTPGKPPQKCGAMIVLRPGKVQLECLSSFGPMTGLTSVRFPRDPMCKAIILLLSNKTRKYLSSVTGGVISSLCSSGSGGGGVSGSSTDGGVGGVKLSTGGSLTISLATSGVISGGG